MGGGGRETGRALRQTFEAAIPPSCLLIADLLSARLSINVVSFVCKKGVSRHEIHFFQLLNIILFAGSLFTSELPHKVTALQVAKVFFSPYSVRSPRKFMV